MEPEKSLLKEFLSGGWVVPLIGAGAMLARLLSGENNYTWGQQLKKILTAGISAGIASLAGSLYVQLNGFISPELTHWTVSGEGLIMIIVGGIGSVSGAILGASVVHIIQHELSNIISWWMFIIGFGFILVVLFMQDGLWGLIERLKKKFG